VANSFQKKCRLLNNSQFRIVLSKRVSARDDLLVLYVSKNDLGFTRIGISIGRASGKAVVRNRLKRLIRETFRQNKQRLLPGFDIVISMSPKWNSQIRLNRIKKPQSSIKYVDIRDSFLKLAAQLNLRAPSEPS